jgi:hypothetical protein
VNNQKFVTGFGTPVYAVLQHEALVTEYRNSKERCDNLEANLHAEQQKRYMQEMTTLYTDILTQRDLSKGERLWK